MLGENEQARAHRTKERTERRGSRALLKAHLQQGIKNINVNNIGPKSSLKSRDNNMPRTSLARSSSLESPKKLRFANDTQFENYRYHRLAHTILWSTKHTHRSERTLILLIILLCLYHTHTRTHFRYSDDALMEVISDGSLRKSRSSSVVCDELTSSCPCIDHVDKTSAIAAELHPINSYNLNANTPLLFNHVPT